MKAFIRHKATLAVAGIIKRNEYAQREVLQRVFSLKFRSPSDLLLNSYRLIHKFHCRFYKRIYIRLLFPCKTFLFAHEFFREALTGSKINSA